MFPLDIKMAKIPSPTSTAPHNISQYLCLVYNDQRFTTKTLRDFLEKRKENHHDRVNRRRFQLLFKPGDIIMD